jgi:uncharacterized protein (UPF0276 family)
MSGARVTPEVAASRLPTGVGLGLRWEFLEEVVDGPELDVAFFEVSPENYMRRGGYYPAALERIRDRYAIVTHGLTLSLGSEAPREPAFLQELKRECERVGTPWHSDHLSFSFAGRSMLHELLPLGFSETNARRVADHLRRAQDALGLPMAVENITYYVEPEASELSEPEFIARVLDLSQAGLLLDVNNVYVNALNHGFDALDFLKQMPLDRVVEIHVAGHDPSELGVVIDTHGAPVAPPVFELLEWVIQRKGPVPVLLERDNQVPELPELLAEVRELEAVYARGLGAHRSAKEARLASGA